ncbi:MAG: MotA/TolQ/ExbB proton channel family protein [Phycisphaeraceae bacterium]|nr:MotA/TolQ/ExbB proton channel family protein [Phycisphaeraceae bacterium]
MLTHLIVAETDSALFKFIAGGGVIGWLIILLSVAAVALVVIHAALIRRAALLPPDDIRAVRQMLGQRQVEAAAAYCADPANDSFFCRVLGPGLVRYLRSPFGAFEMKDALREAGEEQVARLYRSTDGLATIGTVAPLLGLLGTVLGMIGAFDTVATSAVGDSDYYARLASNISLALITTFQGLVVAIPCVAVYSWLRNRIDAYAAEAGALMDEMVLLVDSGAMPRSGGERRG